MSRLRLCLHHLRPVGRRLLPLRPPAIAAPPASEATASPSTPPCSPSLYSRWCVRLDPSPQHHRHHHGPATDASASVSDTLHDCAGCLCDLWTSACAAETQSTTSLDGAGDGACCLCDVDVDVVARRRRRPPSNQNRFGRRRPRSLFSTLTASHLSSPGELYAAEVGLLVDEEQAEVGLLVDEEHVGCVSASARGSLGRVGRHLHRLTAAWMPRGHGCPQQARHDPHSPRAGAETHE